MVGIQLHPVFGQRNSSFPVAREPHEGAHIRDGRSVHRIEGNCSFRSGSESRKILLEKLHLGERVIGQSIGRRSVHRGVGRAQRSVESLRPYRIAEPISISLNNGQHRHAVGVARRLLQSVFQTPLNFDNVVRRKSDAMPEAPKESFIGRQLVERFVAHRSAHVARQNSMHVGHGRDNARRQIIMKFKNRCGIERALIRVRPQLRPTDGIHQLHRDQKTDRHSVAWSCG